MVEKRLCFSEYYKNWHEIQIKKIYVLRRFSLAFPFTMYVQVLTDQLRRLIYACVQSSAWFSNVNIEHVRDEKLR